jgi:hypothetical protein
MKLSQILSLAAAGLFLTGSAIAQDVFQPMPSAANPYVGHGGNALGRPRALNDLELTQISRATESVEVQLGAVQRAQAAVMQASFAQPANAAVLQAAVQTLGDAEFQLALGRADAFAKVKVDLKATTPAKVAAIQTALTSVSTTGGGRGGAPAAAPAAAPAGGRAGAAAPAGRGN